MSQWITNTDVCHPQRELIRMIAVTKFWTGMQIPLPPSPVFSILMIRDLLKHTSSFSTTLLFLPPNFVHFTEVGEPFMIVIWGKTDQTSLAYWVIWAERTFFFIYTTYYLLGWKKFTPKWMQKFSRHKVVVNLSSP